MRSPELARSRSRGDPALATWGSPLRHRLVDREDRRPLGPGIQPSAPRATTPVLEPYRVSDHGKLPRAPILRPVIRMSLLDPRELTGIPNPPGMKRQNGRAKVDAVHLGNLERCQHPLLALGP